ncbi:Golgi integral membrane protein 4 isoform X1 [Cephus cinctus]|uniref:Golgi integral membrane protein 4 isoform X1 n=1 Tax=Cephus cinctus TaxID=211228 RepID=A0AAJ7W3K0_CEPCN|nr:Golgi integral membrane protein 4 isoform X1 [Cephus cinctus]
MNGSRLGRGRGGRLAVYGGGGVVLLLLVFLYRAATSEMARLRELNMQCSKQQEALAAQLHVIFEYKVQLEKSLADEKSSNLAIKQELQHRASREKTLRDKDSMEALQRFNSLQQTYKMLQTEKQDLQEECSNKRKQALEDINKLESTVKDLKGQLLNAREDKVKSLEHLKNKHLELETEKSQLEEKYSELKKSTANSASEMEHLKKEVFQLKRELVEAQKSCKSSGVLPSAASIKSSQQMEPHHQESHHLAKLEAQKNHEPPAGRQEVSRPSNGGENPSPIQAPRDHQPIAEGDQNVIERNEDPNEQMSDSIASTVEKSASPGKYDNTTRATSSSAVISGTKSLPARSNRLPEGVPPILRINDPKLENEDGLDEKRTSKISSNIKQPNEDTEVNQHSKAKPAEAGSKDNNKNDINLESLQRNPGEPIVERPENWVWPKVRHGVQEVGDEPNHLDKIPGFEPDGNPEAGDAADYQYDGGDYEKDVQQKNNDLGIEEGEDEAEEEDDRADYDNDNMKAGKHK